MSKNSEQVTNARLVLNTNKAVVSKRQQPLPDPFKLYNDKAAHEDKAFITDRNESIDTMLVFVRCLLKPPAMGRRRTGWFILGGHHYLRRTNLCTAPSRPAGSGHPVTHCADQYDSGLSVVYSSGRTIFPKRHHHYHQRPFLHQSDTQSRGSSRRNACETMGTTVPTTSDQQRPFLGDRRRPTQSAPGAHLDDLIAWVPMLLHIALTRE